MSLIENLGIEILELCEVNCLQMRSHLINIKWPEVNLGRTKMTKKVLLEQMDAENKAIRQNNFTSFINIL